MTTTTHDARYFWLICDAVQKVSKLSLDWVSWMVFVMQFGLFQKKRASSLVENHQEMATQASHWQLRQMRDYFVYELQHIECQIVALGGITKFQQLKQTGGNLATFQRLFQRREYLLDQIRMIEPQIGLNVYTKKEEE